MVRLKFRAFSILLVLAVALLLVPATVLAQSAPAATSPSASASASAAPSASASAPAASGAASASASASASTSAAPAGSAAASAAPAAAPGQPIGANPPKEEPIPIGPFAFLLIVLAGIWFLYAIVNIIRLTMHPPAVAAAMPPSESGRGFLSFVMPYLAIVVVGIIVTAWGELFLWLGTFTPPHEEKWYTLGVDLFVVCAVMGIATAVAARGSGGSGSAVH